MGAGQRVQQCGQSPHPQCKFTHCRRRYNQWSVCAAAATAGVMEGWGGGGGEAGAGDRCRLDPPPSPSPPPSHTLVYLPEGRNGGWGVFSQCGCIPVTILK